MTTPKTPLGIIPVHEEGNSVPHESKPQFAIGQEVVFGLRFSCDFWFYLRQLRKQESRKWVRELFQFLQQEQITSISIVGIEAFYALPNHMICSQCYLIKGNSWSGLGWKYKLLIKGISDGFPVCVIPNVWIGESSLKPYSVKSLVSPKLGDSPAIA